MLFNRFWKLRCSFCCRYHQTWRKFTHLVKKVDVTRISSKTLTYYNTDIWHHLSCSHNASQRMWLQNTFLFTRIRRNLTTVLPVFTRLRTPGKVVSNFQLRVVFSFWKSNVFLSCESFRYVHLPQKDQKNIIPPKRTAFQYTPNRLAFHVDLVVWICLLNQALFALSSPNTTFLIAVA